MFERTKPSKGLRKLIGIQHTLDNAYFRSDLCSPLFTRSNSVVFNRCYVSEFNLVNTSLSHKEHHIPKEVNGLKQLENRPYLATQI
jgi:hypothetical protein